MNVQDIIALIVVGVAVVYAGRSLWRTLHGETGCGGECGCSKNDDPARKDRALKHIPLVTINSVSAPEARDTAHGET